MEKYYTLIETCVTAEDKNTAIEKPENVLRNNPQGVEYEASVVLNADTKHKAYLQYLSRWIFEHYEDEFEGCSPASFDEFEDCEGEETDEYDVTLVVKGDEFKLDKATGNISINRKQVDCNTDFKIGQPISIWFVGEVCGFRTYKVIGITDEKLSCEFIG